MKQQGNFSPGFTQMTRWRSLKLPDRALNRLESGQITKNPEPDHMRASAMLSSSIVSEMHHKKDKPIHLPRTSCDIFARIVKRKRTQPNE